MSLFSDPVSPVSINEETARCDRRPAFTNNPDLSICKAPAGRTKKSRAEALPRQLASLSNRAIAARRWSRDG
jgi:hypothetical protein